MSNLNEVPGGRGQWSRIGNCKVETELKTKKGPLCDCRGALHETFPNKERLQNFRPGLGAGREGSTVERISVGRIDSAAGRRRSRSATEQGCKSVDRVRNVDTAVVVGVAGIQTGSSRATTEEGGQQEDGVCNVESTVSVAVTTDKLREGSVRHHRRGQQ